MNPKFQIELLEEVNLFLNGLNEKAREIIIYNMRKAQVVNDNELFKKLNDLFGNLGLFLTKPNIDFLRFGTRQTKPKPL